MPFVVEVERVIKVTGGALAPGKQWLITSTEMIDGVDFVALEKKSSGFARFVVGNINPGLRDFTFLAYLRDLRNNAMKEEASKQPTATTCAVATLFAGTPTPCTKKRRNSLNVSDVGASKYLTLSLPAVRHLDEVAEAIDIRIKRPASLLEHPTVEVDRQVLAYIRIATLAHGRAGTPQTRQRPEPDQRVGKGIKWSIQRKAWIASKLVNDSMVYKTFRATETSTSDDALYDARRWVEGKSAVAGEPAEEADAVECGEGYPGDDEDDPDPCGEGGGDEGDGDEGDGDEGGDDDTGHGVEDAGCD